MTKEKVMTEDELAKKKKLKAAVIGFAILEAVVIAAVLLYKHFGR